jgi:hypothetical protein
MDDEAGPFLFQAEIFPLFSDIIAEDSLIIEI